MKINGRRVQLGFYVLLVVFAFLHSAMAQAAISGTQPVVTVAKETLAQQDRLVLGDVAAVQADEPATTARLRAIALGYAPNVGMVRELSRERIALAIQAAGFAAGTVQLVAPAIALVKRATQTVDLTLVQEAIEHATLDALNASGATARLTRLELPPVLEAPAGKIEVRAAALQARDVFAPFTVAVELWQEGVVVKRFNATAQVEAFAAVFVAAREIAANVRLRPEYCQLEIKRLERPLQQYITDPERLRGMAVRRDLRRGDAILSEAMSAEIVVQPGDQVRIIGQSGNLQLFANGEARAAGRIGDRIQVKNLQSGALLQAVVADEGVVRIRF